MMEVIKPQSNSPQGSLIVKIRKTWLPIIVTVDATTDLDKLLG